MTSLRHLLSLMDRREKKRLALLLVASVVAAGLSVASIAAFGPFMALVADAGAAEALADGEGVLAVVYHAVGSPGSRQFLLLVGVGVFVLILLSNAAKVATLHGIHRFAGMRRYTLSLRLFRRYLFQPYAFHIDRNSNRLSQGLLDEVDKVVNGVLRPAIDAFSQGMVVIAILVFLTATSPILALSAIGLLGIAYTAIFLLMRPRLSHLGREHWESNGIRFSTAGEAFGAMKELKVLGREGAYADLYSAAARRHASAEAWLQTYATVPRHLLEAVAFGLIIALILVLVVVHGTMTELLPLLAVYALAGYRLMPALQAVYAGAAQARYYAPTVAALYEDMHGLSVPDVESFEAPAAHQSATHQPVDGREAVRTLSLRDVSFAYGGSDLPTIADADLDIHHGEAIALVGTTGCGKTTLVDIILGLLEPTAGAVLVNGRDVYRGADASAGSDLGSPDDRPSARRRRIQRDIGYVPQDIFLIDATLRQNIALGIPEDRIDDAAVERAARTANLHTFVTQELPAGYATMVGERGVRLSGGQRQRVGIARALYHNPGVLVLDEATNALDSVTEQAVMDAVSSLHGHKTLILVAHRLSTVKRCDRIYLLDHGRIQAVGTYHSLLSHNTHFQTFVGA